MLIVSGGAESVSAAIVAWARSQEIPVKVFSLSENSLLSGLPGVQVISELKLGEQRYQVLARLCEWVDALSGLDGKQILVFPTEDDSLGLVLDLAKIRPHIVLFSRGRCLDRGGLDKVELFKILESKGLAHLLAPTRLLLGWQDVDEVSLDWGNDFIVKPSFKPWARSLAGGAKLFRGDELSLRHVREEIESGWENEQNWIAQPLLRPLFGYERSACVVRGQGVQYVEVVELSKYPARGGSASWVRTQPGSTLLRESAESIATAIDLVGMAELSFLSDGNGRPKLLEINVRPWLQMELLLHAGFDILSASIDALEGKPLSNKLVDARPDSWISLERMALKLITGDGPRLRTFRNVFSSLGEKPVIAVWSTRLPGLQWRWISRNVKRALASLG